MRIAHRALVIVAVLAIAPGLVIAATAEKPTVTCKDGTTGPGGRGACRGHGGVDKSATGGSTAPAAAPATAPAAAAPAAAAPATHAAAKTTSHTARATGGKAATEDSAGAIAKCKDGLYWHGTKHSGSWPRDARGTG